MQSSQPRQRSNSLPYTTTTRQCPLNQGLVTAAFVPSALIGLRGDQLSLIGDAGSTHGNGNIDPLPLHSKVHSEGVSSDAESASAAGRWANDAPFVSATAQRERRKLSRE